MLAHNCTYPILIGKSSILRPLTLTYISNAVLEIKHSLEIQRISDEKNKTSTMLYTFFWIIPRRLKFICQHFGTICLFHLHKQVGVCRIHTYLPTKMEQGVPKRRHINFRRLGITQKKTHNNQNTAKV